MKLQQLGKYQLMDRIAFGGMAEIYRARFIDDAGQEKIAAVKKVLGHLSEDDEFIQMLIDEARISSLLHHPNIAKVYEFGREEQNYFIAMEFVDGKDLRTILENRRADGKPLPIQHALYITISVLRGLHEAHTKKNDDGLPLRIIHRDISPSNVLITYPGQVKLIDFGIAKAVMNRVRTQTGVIKGKVKYMSPEQAMGQELDARSDLFSVGTVLYEMLTNQPPFLAASELDLIFKVRDANVNPPSRQNPAIDATLDAIVLKAMARTRQARYQSGEEFAQALEDYLRAKDPKYHPNDLAALLQKTFSMQIEEERRILEEELKAARNAAGAVPSRSAPALTKSGGFISATRPVTQNPASPRSLDPLRQSQAGAQVSPLRQSGDGARQSGEGLRQSGDAIARQPSSANPSLRQSGDGLRQSNESPSRANTPTPAKGSPSVTSGGARLGSGANPALNLKGPANLPAPNRANRSTAPKIPILNDPEPPEDHELDLPSDDPADGAITFHNPILSGPDTLQPVVPESTEDLPSDEEDAEADAFDTVRMDPVFVLEGQEDNRDGGSAQKQRSLEVLLQSLDFDEPAEEGKPTRVLYKKDISQEPNRRTEKKTILARPLRDLLPSPKKPSGDPKK